MPGLHDEQQSVPGDEPRRCAFRSCRLGPKGTAGIIPPDSRRHRRFCDDICRSSETRARNADLEDAGLPPEPPTDPIEALPAAPAPAPSFVDRFIASVNARRSAANLKPLARSSALTLRATLEAVAKALSQRSMEQELDRFRPDIDLAAEVLPEEDAGVASDLAAALDASATHVGCAALDLGDGKVALAVVFAGERLPRVAA